MNPDQLAELEEERRFLLRSLSDLEREHDAGDVDDQDYDVLRDGYTARAAAVLRAIEEDAAVRRERPPRRWGVTAAWVVGVLLVGVVAGWLVARESGTRAPGQTMTGGQPIDEVTAKLAEARSLFVADPSAAVLRYQEVLDLDPDNAEARTYLGWLLAQSAQGVAGDAAAAGLDAAFRLIQEVTNDTPRYTDAHCFLAIVAARYLPQPDVDLALAEGETCMANDPTAVTEALVGPLMEELRDGSEVTSAG